MLGDNAPEKESAGGDFKWFLLICKHPIKDNLYY